METQNELLPKKLAQIFPTYVVGYDNENYKSINEDVLSKLELEEYTPPPAQPFQTMDNHLENREEYKDLYNWFNECLEDYRKTFQYHCEQFKIILSWANKANDQGSHRMHVHPNSFISGVYYVSEGCSPTYFEDPRYQIRSGWNVETHHAISDNIWTCPSETGTLVLFPSWLPHFTESQPFEGLRYTISFNAIPVGATNKGSLTELNLEK
jgi:uncharacterized protein (TIGR02466 family)